MEIIIAIVLVLIGFVIGRLIPHEHTLGDLRVDRSDPSCDPCLFLELDTDVYDIMHRKKAVFRVKVENFITHE